MNSLKDIENDQDLHHLLVTFYGRVNQDPLLSPVFNDIAQVDWEEHIPQICRFWSSLLFRNGTYNGNPFLKHLRLPLQKEHFKAWLGLFLGTVDELFIGPKASEAKNYALSIADSFQVRLGLLTMQDFRPSAV